MALKFEVLFGLGARGYQKYRKQYRSRLRVTALLYTLIMRWYGSSKLERSLISPRATSE